MLINVRAQAIGEGARGEKIFGVCAGLGKYTAMPAWLWRVIFVVATVSGGIGLITYIVMAIFMPKEGQQG